MQKNIPQQMSSGNNSRWAHFLVDNPPGRLDAHTVKSWNDMRLEYLTHYTDHESKIHVFVKSFVSHRKTKWMSFAKYFQGHSVRVEKFNRYNSPTDYLKGTPHYDTLEQNKFTIDMNDSFGSEARQVEKQAKGKRRQRVRSTITSRLFGLGLEEGQLLPSAGHRGLLAHTMIRFFKDGWTTGRCLELQGYSLIETHRRVLKLENFISGKDFPAEGLAALRAQAFSQRKYILADPTTLCLPMLLGHMRGGFDLQDNAAYRLRALAASIRGLVMYGSEITRLVREHLSVALLAGASDCLFDWPFTFLPDALSSILSEGLPVMDSDQIITRRIEKEQDDLRELIRTKKIPSSSPLVAMYGRMSAAVGELLAIDTFSAGYTRHLPPTPSMPGASYDPEAFMSQLQRHAGIEGPA